MDEDGMAGFASLDLPVAGTTLHYREAGTGAPVLFLHGNPTSSFLWRGVLPRLRRPGTRLIAVDLVGMGASGKPDIGYRLADHVEHVEAFVEALDLGDLTVVAHDWGVAIGLELARRQPGRVRALALMEGHCRPVPGWDAFDPGGQTLFRQLRTPGLGERLALDENVFVETLLPLVLGRLLGEEELKVYRRPYPTAASRRPLLQWAREIPVAGHPADVVDMLTRSWESLARSSVRRLLVQAGPGVVVTPEVVAWCRRADPGLAVVDIGPAGHFMPEEAADRVAAVLAGWL